MCQRYAVRFRLGKGTDNLPIISLVSSAKTKKELAWVSGKSSVAFVQSAFAQNEGLLSRPQGVHHNRPFFQGEIVGETYSIHR
jgi:hypothetical protein